MKRRELVAGLAATGALGLAACKDKSADCADGAAGAAPSEKIQWRMYTTWPKNFPGLGTGANRLAELITAMSAGRLTVTVYGAGERVPALEVFDAVARGSAQMGHGGAYYWKGKVPSSPFFSAVPFGFTAQEMNAWLHFGGGMDLWREIYAPFGLVPFNAGNTGTQMGGWFRKPVTSVADLKGLKMRMPGLGGEVISRLGAVAVNVPGGEIFTALSSGAIDATEWVGPYNDLAFGLYKAAKFYHYPGWHEPGTTLEAIVNKQAFDALPADLQTIIETACSAVSHEMLAEFTARNQQALKTLVDEHGVTLLPFPDDVLAALRETSEAVVLELARADDNAARIYESFSAFRKQVVQSTRIAEQAYLGAR